MFASRSLKVLVTASLALSIVAIALPAQSKKTAKTKTEKATSRPLNRYPVAIKTIPARHIVSIRFQCKRTELSKQFGKYISKVYQYAMMNEGKVTGNPLAVYHSFDKNGLVDVEIACPLQGPIKGKGEVKARKLYAGVVATTHHFGSYATLNKAHDAAQKWMKANKREVAAAPWEVYTSDPTQGKPSEVRTDLFFPLKPKKAKSTSKAQSTSEAQSTSKAQSKKKSASRSTSRPSK